MNQTTTETITLIKNEIKGRNDDRGWGLFFSSNYDQGQYKQRGILIYFSLFSRA